MVWGAQAALAVAASGKRSEMVLTLLSPSPSTRTVAPPPPHMRRRPEDNYSSGHMPSKSNSSRGAYGGGMPQAGPGRPVRGEIDACPCRAGYRHWHVWLEGIGNYWHRLPVCRVCFFSHAYTARQHHHAFTLSAHACPLPIPPLQSNYYSMPEDRVRESSRNMFEDENNRRIADLAGQVSMLKEVRHELKERGSAGVGMAWCWANV